MRFITVPAIVLLFCSSIFADEPKVVWLDQLDLSQMRQDWGDPRKNQAVDGQALSIVGQRFERGVGTHSNSRMKLELAGGAKRFVAQVGINDQDPMSNKASVKFKVVGDGKALFYSDLVSQDTKPVAVDVDLTNVKIIELIVEDAGDGIDFDHADWADARFTIVGATPKALPVVVSREAYILTPPAPSTPRFTGPKVFGVRPGNPLLHKITATGERPITFSATGLPQGVTLDSNSGMMLGQVQKPGEFDIKLTATNDKGTDSRSFKLIVGARIALTPPMGWNSWNCFAGSVSDAKVRSAADAMVKSGLIDHGWSYINIDDCWQIKPNSNDPLVAGQVRDANSMINSCKKFPDMKALTDYIHSKGLRAGIYSSPGPLTCAGFAGSYQFEEKDAQRWANWGFDYVKYDWCSYSRIDPKPSLAGLKKPYQVLRESLTKQNRDIVYSLCQYGRGNVWEWGDEVGGNCWRTTGDITDSWRSMSGIGFSQDGHEKFAKPGCWNDPDMLVVGRVGWGAKTRPTRLTVDEQYTHISLWCLLSSPLLIGCDMTQMDDFTLNLLSNDEVLAINQDPLGKPASRVAKVGMTQVWARDLEDGSKAVGLFNLGDTDAPVSIDFDALGIKGKHVVRDLWRQKDLGDFNGKFESTVNFHGVVMIKIHQ